MSGRVLYCLFSTLQLLSLVFSYNIDNVRSLGCGIAWVDILYIAPYNWIPVIPFGVNFDVDQVWSAVSVGQAPISVWDKDKNYNHRSIIDR